MTQEAIQRRPVVPNADHVSSVREHIATDESVRKALGETAERIYTPEQIVGALQATDRIILNDELPLGQRVEAIRQEAILLVYALDNHFNAQGLPNNPAVDTVYYGAFVDFEARVHEILGVVDDHLIEEHEVDTVARDRKKFAEDLAAVHETIEVAEEVMRFVPEDQRAGLRAQFLDNTQLSIDQRVRPVAEAVRLPGNQRLRADYVDHIVADAVASESEQRQAIILARNGDAMSASQNRDSAEGRVRSTREGLEETREYVIDLQNVRETVEAFGMIRALVGDGFTDDPKQPLAQRIENALNQIPGGLRNDIHDFIVGRIAQSEEAQEKAVNDGRGKSRQEKDDLLEAADRANIALFEEIAAALLINHFTNGLDSIKIGGPYDQMDSALSALGGVNIFDNASGAITEDGKRLLGRVLGEILSGPRVKSAATTEQA